MLHISNCFFERIFQIVLNMKKLHVKINRFLYKKYGEVAYRGKWLRAQITLDNPL